MSTNKPLISVVTSSWNREKYLKILANSLKKQTYTNFEWIIGNDGSIDNTDKFIKSFSKKTKFKITYINSNIRIGKSRMVNLLLNKVSGKYLVECDSDDYFLPNAFKSLLDLIKQNSLNKPKEFAGIFAQNIDTRGISQTFKKYPPKKVEFLKWENLRKKVYGDGTILHLAKFIKRKRYLEVDFLITESSLLNKVFKNKTFLLSSKIVKIMNRKTKNSVSNGLKLQYNRGSVYCIALNETQKIFQSKKFFSKIKIIINYWRYSLHGDVSFIKALKMLSPIRNNYLYTLLFPISYLITLRDHFLGKVEKTHIEFEKNKKSANIDTEILN